MTTSKTNEQFAAEAFTLQSSIFDSIYSGNTIINYKRDRVRAHVENYLKPGDLILELNGGTGEDAVYFAQKGYKVHATDISSGMQLELKQKVQRLQLNDKVTSELCSFTELTTLRNRGPYDYIFSNFAGLNCTDKLDKVLASFDTLLKSKGVVTLVLLPKFCLWESLLVFKGKFKTASRRWLTYNGTNANVEGKSFKCWYYNPSFLIEQLHHNFQLLSIEGLCTMVPPSYIEGFAEKYPKAYKFLSLKEEKYKRTYPWNVIGDYYIITLQKK
jgi:ubiquinone/menaquinone biosynthesis C-methylase UbiE